jgi:hypothetical protein
MNAQAELFAPPPAPDQSQKIFPGANGVKLPYWESDGKLIRVALSDKLVLDVTHQKGGHIYANVPGWGRLEKRGKNAKTNFLSAAALMRRSLELAESMARHGQSIVQEAEEQGKLLRAASEIRTVSDASMIPHVPRARKKDLGGKLVADFTYANPFQDNSKNFGKGPDWLLQRPDLKPIEKLIYARLLFPLPPICKSFDQNLGVIIGLNQTELAKSLGTSRSTLNEWLVSLQFKGWLKFNGSPGAKQTVRFLWKEGMPETCRYVRQVEGVGPTGCPDNACRTSRQQPVGTSDTTCLNQRQVADGVEKREPLREEREEKPTLAEVIEFCRSDQIDKAVATTWWHECESRSWIDRKTQRPIGKWWCALKAYSLKWQINSLSGRMSVRLPERKDPMPKEDPPKVRLPGHFKSWLDARWPELSESAESWTSWAHVPKDVQRDFWGDTSPPFHVTKT